MTQVVGASRLFFKVYGNSLKGYRQILRLMGEDIFQVTDQELHKFNVLAISLLHCHPCVIASFLTMEKLESQSDCQVKYCHIRCL